MSHFACAVLTDGTKTVYELLAPYQEEPFCDDCYLEFIDETERYREDYESSTLEFSFDPDADDAPVLYPPWGKPLRRVDTSSGHKVESHVTPDGWMKAQIPVRLVFDTFEAYMAFMHPDDTDVSEYGGYGYWHNPNARWDWGEIGGRWRGYCKDELGGTDENSIRVGDIRWDVDARRAEAEARWDREHDDPLFLFRLPVGITREQYVDSESHIGFHAVVTPDGEWHEVGSMGWFGISGETPDELREWNLGFRERFLTDPDLTLTVVDCHI